VNILVTGAAGFIGAALSETLLRRGEHLVGIDNLNDYYDVELKNARLKRLSSHSGFTFVQVDISDRHSISELFHNSGFDIVVNLAAQAGVRYSMENPSAYVDANLVGFGNILEGCRHGEITHLVYASSSSVYGSNRKLPFAESDSVDHPISLYAATKKANELMAYAYSHLYRLPTTGLRFFTVYGPWGRPDMALFKFTKGILEGIPIPVYNRGEMMRDFTYIDDIVEAVTRVIDNPPEPLPEDSEERKGSAGTGAPHRIYNIGNSRPVPLMDYIQALEQALGSKAHLDLLPMQPGDVPATEADVSRLVTDFGYRPKVQVEEGITRFVEWYREYYGIPADA